MKKNASSKYKLWLLVGLVVLAVVPSIWIIVSRLEGQPPAITIEPTILSIGETQTLTFTLGDKSGIRKVRVDLVQDGKSVVLVEKEFPSAGFGRKGAVLQESFEIQVEPKKMGFSDGRSVLQSVARDYSWRDWFRGNSNYIEKPVLIDTRPPGIDVLTRMNYVNQGGCGLVLYQLSESCPESGVRVGNNFFPGYSGYLDDADTYVAFFAISHEQGPDTPILIEAVDRAGNTSRSGFPHVIRKKTFRKDRLSISDGFLHMKMPEFHLEVPGNPSPTNLEKYLFVNSNLRDANNEKILSITKSSENTMLWEGPFLRFPNSAPRAGFADFREYYYKGKKIDEQVHMGVDLASLENSPVPAGNTGKVVYADAIGIYGKTVIIDHGLGLFSMYSHLSYIGVTVGDRVEKGDIIGKSGVTGLAAGDHLHYSVLVHNTFVNPIEWWDHHWITDNITRKIAKVKSGLNQE
ncbi:MAG: M23 family metallopeptidase [Desulfobacterales bacterium]